MHLKKSTRYLLLGFSIFIASVIITMMIKEPLIEIYHKFTHKKTNQPTNFPTGSINLGVKIEPPGTAELVLDRENSYLQSIQIINSKVKIKDRPLTWLEDSTTQIPPESYGNKIYFGGRDGAGIVNLKQSQNFPLDVESDQMYKLNLIWFDAAEKQFYQSSLILNVAKLLTQIQLSFLAFRG